MADERVAKPIVVAVCVATCQRPKGLEELLLALNRLQFEKVRTVEITIIVVDNDDSASAQTVCDRVVQQRFRFELVYAVERRRGISYARNRALELAASADFVAFIDDDEIPSAEWLDELLTVQQLYNADVVCGPVLPRFSHPVSDWMIQGRFFERPRFTTGTQLTEGRTGNVLMRQNVVETVGRFEESLALTGGEDHDFFQRTLSSGFQIYWSDQACVSESLPQSRTTPAWLLRRGFRLGNNAVWFERRNRRNSRQYAVSIARAWWQLTSGIGFAPFAILRGRHTAFHQLWRAAFGAGRLAAESGIRFREYETIHGR